MRTEVKAAPSSAPDDFTNTFAPRRRPRVVDRAARLTRRACVSDSPIFTGRDALGHLAQGSVAGVSSATWRAWALPQQSHGGNHE